MKKYIIIVFTISLLLGQAAHADTSLKEIQSARHTLSKSAFRDISPNSKLRPALDWATENEFLKPGGFFRSSEPIPALMFWPLVLQEAGFDKNSATFNTPLPPNIDDDDPLAQFLREAIRRDFISPEDEFDPLKNITQLEALSVLVKTKALLPPRRTSSAFQTQFNMLPSNRAEYLPLLETAFASNMITEADVKNFRPNLSMKRGTLISWLYRFATEGKKQSLLEPLQSPIKVVRKRTNALQKKKEEEQKKQTVRTTIRIINENDDNNSTSITTNTKNSVKSDTSESFDMLKTILSELNSKYRFPEKITRKKKKEMIESAIAAMVFELGDKYTTYIKPGKSKEYEESLNGEIEGIGAYVELVDGRLFITAPITGSPAQHAGILPGDIITHVDKFNIENESITDSVQRIKGPSGTKVLLNIRRGNHKLEVEVVRGKIQIPSVTLTWDRSLPILGIHQFNRSTSEALLKKIKEEIMPKNPRGIIIDLRNNPGGYLTEAVEIGEIFLKKDQTIFSTEFKTYSNNYTASRDGELKDVNKIIILQNKGTASASEILIKALKDYNRAKTIGEITHGKGVIQSLSQYNNGGILKVTVAKWISPNGTWLEGKGIKPDIEIPCPTVEQRKQNVDPQLSRAIHELLSW